MGTPQGRQKKSAGGVIFVYNGHSFDAHETLGLKPGCSVVDAENAFGELKKKVDAASVEFLEAALLALREHLLSN